MQVQQKPGWGGALRCRLYIFEDLSPTRKCFYMGCKLFYITHGKRTRNSKCLLLLFSQAQDCDSRSQSFLPPWKVSALSFKLWGLSFELLALIVQRLGYSTCCQGWVKDIRVGSIPIILVERDLTKSTCVWLLLKKAKNMFSIKGDVVKSRTATNYRLTTFQKNCWLTLSGTAGSKGGGPAS